MNRPDKHTTKPFTLIEIMIAMTVLVIMMGFLFQFINSAQRLWSASESTTGIFDQAQLFLQLLENDFQSALFSSDEKYPGHSIPMGVELDTTGVDPGIIAGKLNNKLFMVTPCSVAEDGVGTFLTMYSLADNQISRFVYDSAIAGYPNPPHCFYGFDPVSAPGQAAAFLTLLIKLEQDSDKKQVIVDGGVESINFHFLPKENATNPISGNNEAFFFTDVPQTIKITLSLYDKRAVKLLTDSGLPDDSPVVKSKITETKRVFSKIIFLREKKR